MGQWSLHGGGVLDSNLQSVFRYSQPDGDERIRSRLEAVQPLTGDFGAPEDVAAAALYLATAPFVSGAVLTVNGGWTAQ